MNNNVTGNNKLLTDLSNLYTIAQNIYFFGEEKLQVCSKEILVRDRTTDRFPVEFAQEVPPQRALELDLKVLELAAKKYRFVQSIHINVYPSSFCNPKFQEALVKYDFRNLTIELIEKQPFDFAKIREIAKQLGTNLALDDFCSEYSNYEALKKLPVTQAKIDRVFLRLEDPEPILRKFYQATKKQKVIPILEGVETEEDILLGLNIGYRSFQGFYFN